MRFKRVLAYAFGPLRDKSLKFAPGMNVVYGPNEAGKSSWHAALYAGLCGLRRARGQPRKEDRVFAERHKPWVGGDWEVGALIALEDGRRVELRHDLAGRVDSSATDATLAGRDYSDEIIHEGAPDGSRWLGLNRRTFLHTACVRQADILRVREDPGSLQEDMQRAAATAGADATAAAAIERLEACLRERVGSARAPTKPLVVTRREVEVAEEALEAARVACIDHMHRRVDAEDQERTARCAELDAAAMNAAIAEDRATACAERLAKAEALNDHFPDGAPHPLPGGGGERLRRVTEALTTWRQRPVLVPLTGPSAQQLAERSDAARQYRNAARAVVAENTAREQEERMAKARELAASFPEGAPRVTAAEEASASEVRDALRDWEVLATPQKPEGPDLARLEAELAQLERERAAAAQPRSRSRLGLAACVALAAIGTLMALFLPDLRLAGLAAAAVGGLALLWLWQADSRSSDSDAERQLEVRRDAVALTLADRRAEQAGYEAALAERAELARRLSHLAGTGAGSEPESVVQQLREREASWRREREARSRLAPKWDELQGILGGSPLADLAAEANRLRAAANERIAAADGAGLDALRAKPISADDLAQLEAEVGEQRRGYAEQRAQRLAAEKRREREAKRVAAATETLRTVAEEIGIAGDEPEALAIQLKGWREDQERSIRRAEERNQSWDRLQQLLGERSLDELASESEELRMCAAELASDIEPKALAEARELEPSLDRLEALRSAAEAARSEADRAWGRLSEREQDLPSVADAEDSLAAAKREQVRVTRLKDTLDGTLDFLRDAQERVLRDIAPTLTHTIVEWLPAVTNGRYTGCRVDPESLLVEVRVGRGRWRAADQLSHGTTEQVYLLLRFALCQHLTREGERCPLILDDVVTALDTERKAATLRTLRALSASTQIVLLTHEDDVLAWANRELRSPNDCVIELPAASRVPAT